MSITYFYLLRLTNQTADRERADHRSQMAGRAPKFNNVRPTRLPEWAKIPYDVFIT